MHFFDVNHTKNSKNDVKIASDKVEGLGSGGVLSTDPTNPADRPHKSKPSGKFAFEMPPYETNGRYSMRK